MAINLVSSELAIVLVGDFCQFRSEWCTLVVNKHRFQASSSHVPLIRLMDLVAKVFGEYLIHTPVTAFAINHVSIIDLESENIMDSLGKTLAPQEPWGDWGKTFEGEQKDRGGLAHIEMIQNNLDDRPGGSVKVSLKPVYQQQRPFCVRVLVNDHFDMKESSKSADKAAKLLYDSYENSVERSKLISNTIKDLAESIRGTSK